MQEDILLGKSRFPGNEVVDFPVPEQFPANSMLAILASILVRRSSAASSAKLK